MLCLAYTIMFCRDCYYTHQQRFVVMAVLDKTLIVLAPCTQLLMMMMLLMLVVHTQCIAITTTRQQIQTSSGFIGNSASVSTISPSIESGPVSKTVSQSSTVIKAVTSDASVVTLVLTMAASTHLHQSIETTSRPASDSTISTEQILHLRTTKASQQATTRHGTVIGQTTAMRASSLQTVLTGGLKFSTNSETDSNSHIQSVSTDSKTQTEHQTQTVNAVLTTTAALKESTSESLSSSLVSGHAETHTPGSTMQQIDIGRPSSTRLDDRPLQTQISGAWTTNQVSSSHQTSSLSSGEGTMANKYTLLELAWIAGIPLVIGLVILLAGLVLGVLVTRKVCCVFSSSNSQWKPMK